MRDDGIWFPAKKYGWGWSAPCCWQGWLVLLGYVALLGFGGRFLIEARGTRFFLVYAAVLSALFFAACWWKGAPLRWRWGKD